MIGTKFHFCHLALSFQKVVVHGYERGIIIVLINYLTVYTKEHKKFTSKDAKLHVEIISRYTLLDTTTTKVEYCHV